MSGCLTFPSTSSSLLAAAPCFSVVAAAAAAATPKLGADTVLLVIAFERAESLRRSLGSVLRHHPCGSGPRVVVSQDGGRETPRWREAKEEILAAQSYLAKKCGPALAPMRVVVHDQTGGGDGYHKLARHFGAAFADAFDDATRRVIVLEEDLEVAPDFFDFFAAVAPALDGDATLLAASAWNDNGVRGRVDVALDASAVVRSDFFGGLGWMITADVWAELAPKWPEAYWDDWLREPAQRKNRQILRPAVCRTFHVASRTGTSNNQYGTFLANILLAPGPPRPFDLRYATAEAADAKLLADLAAAPQADVAQIDGARPASARVVYDGVAAPGPRSFPALAKKLGVMDNEKAGVPRGAYRGVVAFRRGPTTVFLAPHMEQIRAYMGGADYARV